VPKRDGDNLAVLDRPLVSENGTDAEGEGEATTTEAPKRARRDPSAMGDDEVVTINLRMPNALRKQMAATAEEQNTSVPQLVLTMLASAYRLCAAYAYSCTTPEEVCQQGRAYRCTEGSADAQALGYSCHPGGYRGWQD
jgi:hypothetical protein